MKSRRLYLVTGGAGFLGAALVRRLAESGRRVRVLDDLSRGSATRLEGLGRSVEFVRADIRDARAVSKATRGVDVVCHLAFVNGTEYFYSRPELVLEVGVKGMMNVLDACLEHRVKELVVASSSEVYQTPPTIPTDETAPLSIPDPLNPRYSYAAGKILSEILTVNYGRKHFKRAVIFRPHNVYGPQMGWEHVIPQIAGRLGDLARTRPAGRVDFKIQGSGRQTRAFVHIDDFTDGLVRVIDRGQHLGIYHIGTDEEIAIERVVKLAAEYFGLDIRVVAGPEARGGTPRRCPDVSRLRALGWRPKVAFADGLTRTLDWYRLHPAPRAAAKKSKGAP